jgi:hypothetical protein
MTTDPTHRQSPGRTQTHIRRAPVRAKSFNADTGAFTAVLATDTPVQRGDYFEVLSMDPKSIRLGRLKSGAAPLLDSHRSGSAKDQIGIVTDARLENGELIAQATLSPRPDVQPIAIDLAAGTAPAVSVGYRVYASAESRDQDGNLIITRTDWEPFEMSLVAIPADPNAHVRNMKGSTTMPNQNTSNQNANQAGDDPAVIVTRSQDETGQRALEIYEHAANRGLPAEFAREHVRAGSTMDQFRLAVLEESARIADRTVISSRSGGAETLDNPDVFAAAVGDALYARMTGTAPKGAAVELMGRSMLEMGAMILESRGERPNWKNRERLATQILERSAGAGMSTSDFPALLIATGDRVLQNAYRIAQSPLLQIAKRRDAVDFRILSNIKFSEAPALLPLGEGGEVKAGPRTESVESFKVQTYARKMLLTRQAIINDDLGAFSDSASAFGRGAAQTESNLLAGLLTANSGNGANLADGSPLYGTGATRNNKAATGAAIAIDTLGAGRQALRNMLDIDGKTPISATPRHLVVGPALETTAEQFLHTISAVESSNVNPFGGALELHVDPRLTGNAWRLFADPSEVPVLMVAYLNGADGPNVETKLGWDVLGLEIRAVLDFGCGINDFRGTYLNPGA